LFEYEQSLKVATREKRERPSWDQFASEAYEEHYSTVEHIYPQKATLQCWKVWVAPIFAFEVLTNIGPHEGRT